MDIRLTAQLRSYTENRIKNRRRHVIVTVLAVFVALCTGYAMSRPAITMEEEVFCGFEEHQHSVENDCFEKLLVCDPDEAEGHIHTEDCYKDVTRLVCTLEEQKPHEHTEDCYSIQPRLVCELSEQPPHTHTAECCDGEGTLICTLSEEGHTHGEGCYAEEKLLSCTLPEEGHSRTENCYATERELICELPEDGHIHSEECYVNSEKLICEKSEHTHTLQCYSDPNADLEDAAIWESSVSCAELTGDWGKDVVAVAMTQLGYTESSKHYWVAEDGSICGYTRYGEWYGIPCGDWCAMFCSFCLRYAGVPSEAMPYSCGCRNWIEDLTALGAYEAGEYIPKAGDLVFFDWDGDTLSDHVGLVAAVEYSDSGAPTSVCTIEGNSTDAVRYNTWCFGDGRILGYGVLPQNPDYHAEGTFSLSAETEDGYTVTVSGSSDALPCPVSELRLSVIRIEDAEADALMREAADEHPADEPAEDESEVCTPDILENLLFDITIIRTDPESGEETVVEPLSPVTLSILGIEPDENTGDIQVFHVDTEAGTAEMMEADVNDDGSIVLDTDHFSVYGVQLLSVTGTAVDNATAFARLSDGGTYYLTSDITVNTTVNITKATTLNLNGHTVTVKRNPLFNVTGGTLTIGDSKSAPEGSPVSGTKYGNAASYSSDTLTYYITEPEVTGPSNGATTDTLYKFTVSGVGMINGDGSYRAISVSGGTVNLNSGYICNCSTSDNGGAVYMSGGTVNLGGCVLAANKATGKGGAIAVMKGTLNIKDGAVSGNIAQGSGGGGVYVGAGKVYMSGGAVTNNRATDTGYWSGGGGVLVGRDSSYGEFTLSGGYVSGNQGAGGGGIRTEATWSDSDVSGKIYMHGGFVSSNNSTVAEGGGISISPRGYMEIIASEGKQCYITNNVAGGGVNDKDFDDWGGGGLFCSENSCTVYIEDALLTENSAGGFGGGVAGCSTGRINVSDDHGAAIFGNSAAGENCSGSGSTKNQDHFYAMENPVFMSHGYQDYFCALSSTVSGSMLGGGSERWEGTSDGNPVSTDTDEESIIGGYVTGLSSLSSEGDRASARAAAKVFFNGNESPTHGGGILANGYLVLGRTNQMETYARLELTAEKKLLDKDGKSVSLGEREYSFAVTDEDGNILSLGKNDGSGKISFDRMLPFTAAGTYTYYIFEQPTDEIGIQQDTAKYELVITVGTQTTGQVPWTNIGIIQYVFTNIKSTEINENKVIFNNSSPKNDESHAVTLKPLDSGSFVNRLVTETTIPYSVSVEKKWGGNTAAHPSSVSVTLYDGDTAVSDSTVTLSASNSWKHTWEGLNASRQYTVKEESVSGYKADYSFRYNYTTGYSAITSSEKSYTITNTPIESVKFALTIHKTDETGDLSLSNAGFELYSGDTPLHFTYNSTTGKYSYTTSTAASTQLTTSAAGYIYLTDLPGGSYRLVETEAPFGYTKAEPVDIVLGAETEGRLLTVTVKDTAIRYTLPETGGMGITGMYILGAFLSVISAVFGAEKLYRRKKFAEIQSETTTKREEHAMKKLFSVLLILVLVFSLSASAFAANADVSTHSFKAYQIFSGKQETGKDVLTDVKWGSGVNGEALLDALQADTALGTVFADCTTAASVAQKMSTWTDGDASSKAFAKLAYANKMGDGAAIGDTLDAGYYLVVDVTSFDKTATDTVVNLALLQLTNKGTFDTASKVDIPTVQKKVKDTDDSTYNSTSGWQDSADYDIGDTVPFQLEAKLGTISDYDTYKLVFHDTQFPGFDAPKDIAVKIDSTTLTSGYTTNTTGNDFTVTIADVKALGADDNSVVTVEYTAVLNSGATKGSAGNANEVYLEYSNNPNVSGIGNTNTGTTPKDVVKVFTYSVTVNKVDEQNKALKGAGFTLYKWKATTADAGSWEKIKEYAAGEIHEFVWEGIDDGKYKLVESTVPAGYNAMEDLEFVISAEHDLTKDNPALTKLNGGSLVNGEFKDTGLIKTDVINYEGVVLPETGGVGTTVFYVVGSLLLVGALVLIITKKRMGKEG